MKENKIIISTCVAPETLKKLQEIADEQQRPLSQLVNMLLVKAIKSFI